MTGSDGGDGRQGQKVVQAFGQERDVPRSSSTRSTSGCASAACGPFSSPPSPTPPPGLSTPWCTPAWALSARSVADRRRPVPWASSPAFLSYANQYTKPFNEISGVVTELQNALASRGPCVRADRRAGPGPRRPGRRGRWRTLRRQRGHSRTWLSPTGRSSRLIEDFNLQVQPGQRVAMVGPTGCGKTTVINLLMRFYDVDSGYIRVERHGHPGHHPPQPARAATAWCCRTPG